MKNAEHFVQGATHSFLRIPTGDTGGRWIHENDTPREVGGDNAISEALKGLEVTVLTALALVFLEMPLGRDFDREAEFVVIERFQQIAMRMRLPRTGHGVEISTGGDINDGDATATL